MHISIPAPCLVLLVGATSSGKSTFARTHFLPAEVISSDACRALIAGDENALGSNAEAFDLVHTLAATRLAHRRTAVIDATNVLRDARRPLLALARDTGVPAVAIVLDLPEAVLLQRSRERPDRTLLPHVVRGHRAALRRSLRELRKEGFRDVHVLMSPDQVGSVVVERVAGPPSSERAARVARRRILLPSREVGGGPTMTQAGTRDDAHTAVHRDALFIDGAWVPATGTGRLEVFGAATEEVIGSIPEGDATDAERGVAAAVRAFPAWSATPVAERAALLRSLQAALFARAEELARLIASEVGMPLRMSTAIQVGLPCMVAGLYAQIVEEFAFEERVGHSLVVREPVGVVAAITPWNYPLHQTVAKLAPALAAGCTVVHKPSEVAPLSAFVLAEVLEEIGLPAGVYNLVSGTGPVVGEALASHPQVDMVSFTGSTRAGRRVSELAAQSVKRVALELGGKSANVLLDDADLGRAVGGGVSNAFLNSGQTCTALTRMLVPRARQEEAVELAVAVAARLPLGDPLGEEARLGPLASAAQRERVRGYIERGVAEGARLVTGGAEAPDDLPRGYYVRPTIFADVTADMTIAQEEIFGPVLAIMPYDDEEEALRIANGTVYGLAGAVWSADEERARAFARRLRTGQVDINGGGFNPLAPFGGYKQSGLGRELGRWGLEEFLETKSLQLRS